jgi:DNA invertase Pin-like site-specific DNA recombinase
MPSVVQQRDDLTRFGVPIEGFRHPAPDILESWTDRIGRLIDTLQAGDVLVVANIHALGRDLDEEARTVAALRRHGVMVKVLSHDARHLADAGR